jgi:hypothetical protein
MYNPPLAHQRADSFCLLTLGRSPVTGAAAGAGPTAMAFEPFQFHATLPLLIEALIDRVPSATG